MLWLGLLAPLKPTRLDYFSEVVLVVSIPIANTVEMLFNLIQLRKGNYRAPPCPQWVRSIHFSTQ